MLLEIALIILLIVLIILVSFVLYNQFRNKDKDVLVDTRLKDLDDKIDKKLDENSKTMFDQVDKQFERSTKMIKDLTQELTEIKSTGKEMLSFTEQLESLERILKNPQKRGVLGERVLGNIISNILPPDSFEAQYCFKNGVRADMVIFLADKKKIAIDSKFPLDNYSKLFDNDVKNKEEIEKTLIKDIKCRIDETSKYIIPKENTLDFAFMFIPSESLYYDLLSEKIGVQGKSESLIEYAFFNKKVIIVSPTTLLAYLQTVQMGLKYLKIEEGAKTILKRVQNLQNHLIKYSKNFEKVGKSLGTTVTHFNNAQKQYSLIDKDVIKITEKGKEKERLSLNAPEIIEDE